MPVNPRPYPRVLQHPSTHIPHPRRPRTETALLLSVVLLTAGAGTARGQINLQYSDCASGIANVNDACSSNTGTHQVIGSFQAPAGTTAIDGEQAVVDIQLAGGTVPPWWQAVVAGSCRGSAVSVAYNAPPPSCADYFNTVATPIGGFGYDYYPVSTTTSPGRVRIRTVSAVPIDSAKSLDAVGIAPGTDTYVFTVTFTMANTVDAGSCAGCAVVACWVFNSLLLAQPVGVGDIFLVSPGDAGQYLTWQSSAGEYGAPCSTPAQRTSWGQVKSLYR